MATYVTNVKDKCQTPVDESNLKWYPGDSFLQSLKDTYGLEKPAYQVVLTYYYLYMSLIAFVLVIGIIAYFFKNSLYFFKLMAWKGQRVIGRIMGKEESGPFAEMKE